MTYSHSHIYTKPPLASIINDNDNGINNNNNNKSNHISSNSNNNKRVNELSMSASRFHASTPPPIIIIIIMLILITPFNEERSVCKRYIHESANDTIPYHKHALTRVRPPLRARSVDWSLFTLLFC